MSHEMVQCGTVNEGGKMRKGVTPIIAIIVLLLITVALAGATWTYLLSYWQGIVGKNIQIMDSYCIAGDEGIILVRNTGTQDIKVADITVINTTSGSDPSGDWYDLGGNYLNATKGDRITPGQVVRYNMSCERLCLFRFLAGGRTMIASVQC